MGQQTVARDSGVDDGDGLACTPTEGPHLRQVENIELVAGSASVVCRGRDQASLPLLGFLWWSGWPRIR
jgi:hypothetical protein